MSAESMLMLGDWLVGAATVGVVVAALLHWRKLTPAPLSQPREASVLPHPEGNLGWSTALALLMLGLAALWLHQHQSALPERIAVHWDRLGRPNGWGPSHGWRAYSTLLFGGVLVCLMALLGASVRRDARRTRTRRVSIQVLGAVQLLEAWTLGGLTVASIQADGRGPLPKAVLLVGGVSIAATLALLGWAARAMIAQRRAPADEDPISSGRSVWRGGLFYVNPEDPALWVPKRIGLGYTLNFGQPKAWWIMAALLLLPLLLATLLSGCAGVDPVLRPALVGTEGAREVGVWVGPAHSAVGGTLLLPPGPGPHPAALLLAGSGPQDRDERQGARAPLRELAEALSRRGVATLRFDKRSLIWPQQVAAHPTVELEQLDDAVAAIRLLSERPEVDAARLAVIGHSLGAFLAPEVAERFGKPLRLVLLAAPARPLSALLIQQLRLSGAPAVEVDQAVQLSSHRLSPEQTVLGVPASYFYDVDARDEVGRARRLGLPTLVLRGDEDQNVFAEDQAAWASALSGCSRCELHTLRGVDHLLGAPEGGSLSAELVARVTGFLQQPPPHLANIN